MAGVHRNIRHKLFIPVTLLLEKTSSALKILSCFYLKLPFFQLR